MPLEGQLVYLLVCWGGMLEDTWGIPLGVLEDTGDTWGYLRNAREISGRVSYMKVSPAPPVDPLLFTQGHA